MDLSFTQIYTDISQDRDEPNSYMTSTRYCRGNLFFNSENNVYYPFNVLRNSTISEDSNKAIGCEIIVIGNRVKRPKSHAIRHLSDYRSTVSHASTYYTAKNNDDEDESYYVGNHMIYQPNFTENEFLTNIKYLMLLCVRTEKLRHVISNEPLNPKNYVLMVDSSCLLNHKSIKSFIKLYANLGIDVIYTHSILSNFNTYRKDDMLNMRRSIDDVLAFTINEVRTASNSNIVDF